MATEFKLPELGENIESGDLVRLMIKPGASIAEGEPVMELETDKAVVEVPSSVTGTIGKIHVKEGDKLRVGQVIFTVENGAGVGTKPASKPVAQSSSVDLPIETRLAAARQTGQAPSLPPERRPIPTPSASTAGEFKMPELGENIDSGDLVRLMIAPGARVSEGQPVMELETDKAVVEVPSSVSGVVREIKVKEGQKVKVGEVIFTLEGGAAHVEPAPQTRTRGTHLRTASGAAGVPVGDARRGQNRRTGAAAGSAASPRTGIQHARATGQGCRHGPRSHSGSAARAPPGARNRREYSQCRRQRPGRAHQ